MRKKNIYFSYTWYKSLIHMMMWCARIEFQGWALVSSLRHLPTFILWKNIHQLQFHTCDLRVVHKLFHLKICNFWPPSLLLVVFFLSEIGNFWPPPLPPWDNIVFGRPLRKNIKFQIEKNVYSWPRLDFFLNLEMNYSFEHK